jgi:hypothetical protein
MEFRLFSETILKEAIMAHYRMRIFIGLVCMFGVGASAFAAPGDCDRACLKTALDQYLNAVISHNPSAAPLFGGFRQTENAIVVKLGTGVLEECYRTGQDAAPLHGSSERPGGYFGIVEEGASSAIVTARVRVEDRKITEAGMVYRASRRSGVERPESTRPDAGESVQSGSSDCESAAGSCRAEVRARIS